MSLKYAVVDIETTGNNIETDEMIQIGIAIVQNQSIIQQYDSFIHTRLEIPHFIKTLTQIDQSDVLNAPHFYDVKETIYHLLDNCVFVAHNVEFDLKFLQKYFADEGIKFEPKYTIDTVDLSKMLFPTFRSYQLKQITLALNIQLENAHRAIDDAVATAELLIASIQKLKSMPIDTLKQIYHITKQMRYDIDELVFETIMNYAYHPQNVIKRGQFYVFDPSNESFNFKWHDSFEAFYEMIIHSCNYEYRTNQYKLSEMFLNQMLSGQEMAVEADLGSGKTLSYVIAALYFITLKKESVLISTSTILLQNQLLNQEIKKINEALNINLPVQLIKSKHHYLSIEFIQFLMEQDRDNHDSMILKVQLLVFILESDGDIEKLNLNGGRKIYFELMQVLFDQTNVHYLMPKQKHPCIGITNHAHIASIHHEKLFNPFKHLIVDEAHQLLNYFLNQTITDLSYERVKYYLSQIQKTIEYEMTSSKKQSLNMIQKLQKATVEFKQANDLFEAVVLRFLNLNKERISLENDQEIISELVEIYMIFDQYQSLPLNTTINKLSSFLVDAFNPLIHCLMHDQNVFVEIKDFNKSKFTFSFQQHDINTLIDTQLNHFQSKTFLSGTLKSLESLYKSLNIINGEVLQYQQPLNIKAPCFIPLDIETYQYTNRQSYFESIINYIVYFLQTKNAKTLILVNSFEQVEIMKTYLQDALENVVILSQTKNTQTSKLNQQFNDLEECVLIGTQSFYEGIDFQFSGFKCVMIITLPFMHKEDYRLQLLKHQLDHPFFEYTLPMAVNTFEQATGRLIRNKNDQGLLMCFDHRLLNANYKNFFIEKLNKFEIITGDMNQFEKLLQNLS
ncbi:helicase C-terminal domain-containing protein [Macrococcus sp. DPC7161]|uniref:helicase C-terminal domain-containing protein n=1 Tax=Macrococcus sp. DPC7161 TaxID=2507060 RepID=UPI00100B796E|nr:helicase C-terminal domain-containing protein [Macrococcus sp. DPC7161]RXK19262.1 DEAD/DEAH box helicase [Macrococcus sp. DPC7161]